MIKKLISILVIMSAVHLNNFGCDKEHDNVRKYTIEMRDDEKNLEQITDEDRKKALDLHQAIGEMFQNVQAELPKVTAMIISTSSDISGTKHHLQLPSSRHSKKLRRKN